MDQLEGLTSVSSVLSSSKAFVFEAGESEVALDQIEDPLPAEGGPERCNPAFSRSSSVQVRMEDKSVSISNRFGSPLGVARNCKSTFVTSRRSTFVFVDVRRKRRSASTRCSFMMTARPDN